MRYLHITKPGEHYYQLARAFVDAQYTHRLGVENPAHADIFSCICEDNVPIATTGVFMAETHSPLFFERFFDRPILYHINARAPRSAFAEIGALAVDVERVEKKQIQLLAATTILSAGLAAYQQGISHIVFVGDKLLSRFSKIFSIEFSNLGTAIPKNIDPVFQEKLERYLRAGRATYTTETEAIPHAFSQFDTTTLPTLHISLTESVLHMQHVS